MPATRGVKRTASKSAASAASSGPKNKKKRNVVQLEVPTLPKRRGRVLTCGQGDVGQLGLGEDVIETSRFKHVTGLGEKIVEVCAGGMHTIAIDSDGKVWTFGCNDEGALGRATSGDADEGTPKQVSLPLPAVAVSAGDSHSAALLNNGHVYAWGSFRDSHGSMGLVVRGREGKPCREPVKVDVPEPAARIASGSDHLVILTTSGSVYTMGCGEQGQLGRLAQRSANRDTRQGFSALLVPSKVTLKQGASRVWAGYHATVVLDGSADKVFAWGLNNYGQLGITGDKRKTALYSPLEADAFTARGTNWQAVAPGQHHSLATDNHGQTYAIGRCEYGRLGLGDQPGDAECLEPIPMLQNKKVVSIAAGTSNSFAVTDTGEIFAWGMGSEGQLGTGACSDAASPTAAVSLALADRAPARVSAGGQHTVLLVTDPNAKHEPSPAPEAETEEQKTEDVEEEEEEPEPVPEKKPKGRANKRQKKQEQEEEVSSTSSALASDVTGDSAPQAKKKRDTPSSSRTASTAKLAKSTSKTPSGKSALSFPTTGTSSRSSKSEARAGTSSARSKPRAEAGSESSKSKVVSEASSRASKSVRGESEASSSTSKSARGTKKVNGDEKKETPMEVDETDSKADKPEESKAKEERKETEATKDDTKQDHDTDSSSQDTVENEPSHASQDVEMKEPGTDTQESKTDTQESKIDKSESDSKPEPDSKKAEPDSKKAEVNGAPEETQVEVKSVETIQTDQAVVSSA